MEAYMLAVKGLYSGGDTVTIDRQTVPLTGHYEVMVTFLRPAKESSVQTVEIDAPQDEYKRRRASFERLLKYAGRLSVDFDYKKELARWRDERFGSLS
jgi:hypothetical protein